MYEILEHINLRAFRLIITQVTRSLLPATFEIQYSPITVSHLIDHKKQ
jgi:hypothetical protein